MQFSIWLDEWIVKIIKFGVGISIFIFCIASVGIVFSFMKFLICKRKEEKKLIDFFKSEDILLALRGLLISGIVLILFYLPQQVLPDTYKLDNMSIETMTVSSMSHRTDRVTIDDNIEVEEFKNIFSGQTCRRSIDSGRTMLDSDVVFIDFVAHENNRAYPLHFIVEKDHIRRYVAGNTDFIYVIKDNDHLLAGKVFDFVNKYVKKYDS